MSSCANFHIDELFSDLPVRIIWVDPPFFYASDVAEVLGIKKYSLCSKLFYGEDIVSMKEREKYNIVTYQKYKNGTYPDQAIILLTERGVYRMISEARSPIAEAFRGKMRLRAGFRATGKSDFIDKIKAIFSAEVFECGKCVIMYHVDLYMPKYNLAIEFDEQHHERQQDELREVIIGGGLGCTFIRVRWDDDIFAAAGRIYAHIHQ